MAWLAGRQAPPGATNSRATAMPGPSGASAILTLPVHAFHSNSRPARQGITRRSAQEDFEALVARISERSPEGAERWVASFERALSILEKNPFVAPLAIESEELGKDVRNVMFRTRAGRAFRALFVVVGDEARILRIRGSDQPPVSRRDVEL